LSNCLALEKGLAVTAIDGKEHHTLEARRLGETMARRMDHQAAKTMQNKPRQSAPQGRGGETTAESVVADEASAVPSEEPTAAFTSLGYPRKEEKEEPALKRSKPADAITEYLDPDSDFSRWEGLEGGALLVGLHTCGDLGPLAIQTYLAKAELRGVVSVGCCYERLTEDGTTTAGFPLSSVVKATGIKLSEPRREHGNHTLVQWCQRGPVALSNHGYRAMLEV